VAAATIVRRLRRSGTGWRHIQPAYRALQSGTHARGPTRRRCRLRRCPTVSEMPRSRPHRSSVATQDGHYVTLDDPLGNPMHYSGSPVLTKKTLCSIISSKWHTRRACGPGQRIPAPRLVPIITTRRVPSVPTAAAPPVSPFPPTSGERGLGDRGPSSFDGSSRTDPVGAHPRRTNHPVPLETRPCDGHGMSVPGSAGGPRRTSSADSLGRSGVPRPHKDWRRRSASRWRSEPPLSALPLGRRRGHRMRSLSVRALHGDSRIDRRRVAMVDAERGETDKQHCREEGEDQT
jgi:hypothetical protein